MEVFSGFRVLKRIGSMNLMPLGATRVEGFDVLEEAGDVTVRGEALPAFSRLRLAGNLLVRGGGRGFGELTSLQSAGVVDVEGLVHATVLDFPLLTRAASFMVAECPRVVSVRLPLVEQLDLFYVTTSSGVVDLSAPALGVVNGPLSISWTSISELGGLQRLSLVRGDLAIVGNESLPLSEIEALLGHITLEGDLHVCYNKDMANCLVW